MSIKIIVEDKSGQILGQATSHHEKITIGSDPNCTLLIKNNELAALECEIYFLNKEWWIQASKDGASLTNRGKPYRTLKIDGDLKLHLRGLTMKVNVSDQFLNELEKTKEHALEDQMTRVVGPGIEDSTRIVSNQEATRVVAPVDFKRIVENEQDSDNSQAAAEAPTFSSKSLRLQRDHSYQEDLEKILTSENMQEPKIDSVSSLRKIRPKELLIGASAILGFVFLYTVLTTSSPSSEQALQTIAQEQQMRLHTKSSASQNEVQTNVPSQKKELTVQAVSPEEYLSNLSGLFDRN